MRYRHALHPAANIRLLGPLFKSLESTLSYYNRSKEALVALHDTVFYNVIHSQGNANDRRIAEELLTDLTLCR